MEEQPPVVDADSHKCENPVVLPDFVEPAYRARIGFVRDRYGEQRIRIVDRDPQTGRRDLARLFLQPDGYGKGTYRPYHRESTLGGLFNRIRLEHMDREGIDHQVIYGSVALAFASVLDPDLAAALCRGYNDYIHADCEPHRDRLHPVAFLPLQDPGAAVAELRRCVLELGMPGVCVPPNLPAPHPDAPDAFPSVRVPKPLSHPDFAPVLREAERLDVSIGIHGAPGLQLAGGSSDQLETFTLVHVFANRSMQQMALARLAFDGVFERHPRLRFGFLEAGCGWLPDLVASLDEHWEKRVAGFDPSIEPGVGPFLSELVRERRSGVDLLRRARGLMSMLFSPAEEAASDAELERFRHEHPHLPRRPSEYLARGQVFLTCAPDDPAPAWLPQALPEVGSRLCGMALDYGHWDCELDDCVARVRARAGTDADFARRLLGENCLDFFGPRLRSRVAPRSLRSSPGFRAPRLGLANPPTG